jgi:hypothetical protein
MRFNSAPEALKAPGGESSWVEAYHWSLNGTAVYLKLWFGASSLVEASGGGSTEMGYSLYLTL